jgi:hypothetical protein
MTQNHFSLKKTDSEWVVDCEYFSEKKQSVLEKMIRNSNEDDTIIVDREGFDDVVRDLDKFFPQKKFVKKIKLGNSGERVIIKNKVSIKVKRANLGRLLRRLYFNNQKS